MKCDVCKWRGSKGGFYPYVVSLGTLFVCSKCYTTLRELRAKEQEEFTKVRFG